MEEKKQTYGILGKNITYSLSPLMHTAAFRTFGINAEYVVFDRKEDEIDKFFSELTSGRISGINVTVPYKVLMCEMLKGKDTCTFDESAGNLGAVNTVKVEEGGERAYNTDGKGFAESLKEDAGFDTTGKKVFILGAGGAARAISFYLAQSPEVPSEIFIFDIDKEKVTSLIEDYKNVFSGSLLKEVTEKSFSKKISESDLVVNATPIGTKEAPPSIDPELLKEGCTVYDLVYARETELVKVAREKGLTATGGLGMLLNQAALAFSIWTDDAFYLGDVRKAMKTALPDKLKKVYGWNT